MAPATPPVASGTIVESAPAPTATSVLTTTPNGLPKGTVTSPFCGPDGNCCGPVGGNGPVTYELYANTGPALIVGGSELSGRLNTGWRLSIGARTLFFNTERTAAWVLDTGVGYTYNRGRQERGGPVDVHTPRVLVQNVNGQTVTTPLADALAPHLVRGLHRTTFNYGVGRDWWFRGPGAVGTETGPNTRVGFDVGGRYGTGHSDLVPDTDRGNYLRKQSVVSAVYLAAQGNWERPMGNWIFFTGMRGEFDYTFTNVLPPKGSDIVGINILFSMGVRY
jgi:hypothetical protein